VAAKGAPATPASDAPVPLSATHEATSVGDVTEAIKSAAADRTPVYPFGGKTSLDYGLPAKRTGIGLSLAKMTKVIDYPARDMTITVEAGITMAELAKLLAAEGQQLAFDVPNAEAATLGGVVATNHNGPRRLGYGGIRDFVIGIEAVDGMGNIFHGGGRVVKNVAGYDFCKLLTGSMGTIGVITQLTMKLRPVPQASDLVVAPLANLKMAEAILDAMSSREIPVAALQWLAGPAWKGFAELPSASEGWLVARLEGTSHEVTWMRDHLLKVWSAAANVNPIAYLSEKNLWPAIIDFSRRPAALTLKASVRPSQVSSWIQACRALDANVSICVQAASGMIYAQYEQMPQLGIARGLIGKLQPAANSAGGNVVVYAGQLGSEATQQAIWGNGGDPLAVMTEIKRRFDPQNILNPGRFVFLDAQ
jgi:glycolate oxidase FAD binding subunit